MRTNGVEATIARYNSAGTKKRCAQSELRANGERVLGGFTVISISTFGNNSARTPR